jgi:hypothetical protein
MKKAEILRDTGIIVGIWGTLLTVLFVTPVFLVSTKVELAIPISVAAVIAFPLYFMKKQVLRRLSFLFQVLIAVLAVGLLAYVGYVLDLVVFLTWQWVQINNIFVVTWVNMLDIFLFLFSLVTYYWAARTTISSIPALREEWHKSARKRKSRKQAKAIKDS